MQNSDFGRNFNSAETTIIRAAAGSIGMAELSYKLPEELKTISQAANDLENYNCVTPSILKAAAFVTVGTLSQFSDDDFASFVDVMREHAA